METLNTVNEVQEPVVEAQNPEEATSAEEPGSGPEGTGTPGQEAQPPGEGAAAQPPQSPEDNSRFAAIRRQYEAQLHQEQAQREQAQQAQEKLLQALGPYGYTGSPEEIADQIEAQRSGVSVEQVRANREAEEARIRKAMERDPAYRAAQAQAEQYRQMVFQTAYQRDMEAINKAYPDAKIKALDDLGPDFAAMRAGGVSALAAYAAIRQAKEATAKPLPPEMGAVNAAGGKEKDYYSPEEADRLTPEQLDDPKVMATVMKSMTKWK